MCTITMCQLKCIFLTKKNLKRAETHRKSTKTTANQAIAIGLGLSATSHFCHKRDQNCLEAIKCLYI
jgi:hypothetical protein